MKINAVAEGLVEDSHEANYVSYKTPYVGNPGGFNGYFIYVTCLKHNDFVIIDFGDEETLLSERETLFQGHIESQEDFRKVLKMVAPTAFKN